MKIFLVGLLVKSQINCLHASDNLYEACNIAKSESKNVYEGIGNKFYLRKIYAPGDQPVF